VLAGTWNVNETRPSSAGLEAWLGQRADAADLVLVGLQVQTALHPSPPLSPSDRHAGAPPADLPPKLVPVDLPPTLVALDLPPTLSAVNLSSCSLNSHRPRQPAPLRQRCT
jgi:hypothetical protein